jgi:hypothetical protein
MVVKRVLAHLRSTRNNINEVSSFFLSILPSLAQMGRVFPSVSEDLFDLLFEIAPTGNALCNFEDTSQALLAQEIQTCFQSLIKGLGTTLSKRI